MTIEYTYTTYQQPQSICNILYLEDDIANTMITELRKRAVIANEITQFFWCNFTTVAYGMCFLLRTVPTEGEPDTWFGLCEVDSGYQHITSIRKWHVNLEKTQGLEWFTAPYGISAGGNPYPSDVRNGDQRLFGYGYDTRITDDDILDRRRMIFGLQVNALDPQTVDPNKLDQYFEPRFILPPKSIFLEGMHVDTCGVSGNMSVYVDVGGQREVHWNYKEVEKATETGN